MVMWPETNNPSVETPEVKPMPERPSRCRRKDKDEPRKKRWEKASKNGIKMTCSICHQTRHNMRNCKSVPSQQPTQQPSQQPSQQTSQSRPVSQPSTQHSSSLCPSLCPETSRVQGSRKQELVLQLQRQHLL